MTMNLFNPSTTPGVANIILLVIAFVFFLITLCLALKILKHHYKSTNNQPGSIKLNEYQPNQDPDTTPRSDQPHQHTEVFSQPNQLPENKDLLQIHVGNQPFGIPKNDVRLTDLLAKFNLIIFHTTEHITLDDKMKLAIKELRQHINDWEIKALKDDIVPDSTQQSELKWFASVLPALNELMKSNE